jgi:FkbM family methyltransferase
VTAPAPTDVDARASRFSDFARSANLIGGHAVNKMLKPLRDRRWRAAKAPFRHRGARGLLFDLQPGEIVDYYIYTEGLFEKRFLHLVERLFPNGGVAVDVGANIGNHSLFFSSVFDTVHAFEPNPKMVERLKTHAEMNAAKNLHIHAVGLSDRNAELFFEENLRGNAGNGRFVSRASGVAISLPVRRGDDVLQELGVSRVDFIKLDIEGHEEAALRGLERTIARHRPIVAFEFHPDDFPEGHDGRLRAALPGYEFFDCALRPPGGGALHALASFVRHGGLPEILPLRDMKKGAYPNILAVPAK